MKKLAAPRGCWFMNRRFAALDEPWPKLQRMLIADHATELMQFAAAVASVVDGQMQGVEFCREKLSLPQEVLNPAPLITGDDLKGVGIPPGRAYQTFLESMHNAQLVGEVDSRSAALEMAKRMWAAFPPS